MTNELEKAKQLEIELIVSEASALKDRFEKIDLLLNKTEHEKISKESLRDNEIANMAFIMPNINQEYKELIQENVSMLTMVDHFRRWTSQLETLLILNKHNLHKAAVRRHLNDIFDTVKIIVLVVEKTYKKKL